MSTSNGPIALGSRRAPSCRRQANIPMEQNPMTEVTPSELAHSSSLEALCRGLGQIQMVAGWNRPTQSSEPGKSFRPHRWSYVQAKAALDAAGRLITTGLA